MIDLERESILGLVSASKHLPEIEGRRPHLSTVWRWIHRGIKGAKLESVRIGGRVYTSKEAIDRFQTKLDDIGANTRGPKGLVRQAQRSVSNDLGVG